MDDKTKKELEARKQELDVEFKALDKQRIETTNLLQRIIGRQTELSGAYREVKKLLGEPLDGKDIPRRQKPEKK